MDDGAAIGARAQEAWAAVSERLTPSIGTEPDVYRDAVRASHPRALAEAIALIIIGFSVDDLNVLRVPGFLVGLGAAVAVLAFGALLHARTLARRLTGLDPDAVQEGLARSRNWGRFWLVIAVVGFFAWLVAFSSGVPPWAV